MGPGWPSFAVADRLLFTQDQRGPKETVLCYDADSGREIWKTEFDGRLDDPLGGPGPRATPTLANGALYVVGSTGAFLRLNPVTGEIHDSGFDCVMEIWWNSREDFENSQRLISDPERVKFTIEDEKKLFSTSANPICIIEDEYDSPVGPEGVIYDWVPVPRASTETA